MKISSLVGDKQLQSYLQRSVVMVRRERESFVKAEAEALLEDSLAEVPRDTNTLADSAYIARQSDGSYICGYGMGSNVNPKSKATAEEYMVKQHEDLSLRHPNGGKAKFLEDPARKREGLMARSLAERVRRALRRSLG